MNERYLEIVQRINELTSTMSEAFDHIVNIQIPELRFEDSFYLLNDIIEAFLSISNALRIIQDEFELQNVMSLGDKLHQNLEELLELYKEPVKERLLKKYKDDIIPSYEMWLNELLVSINKYQA
ncbi:hypothetical protein Csac_2203 [Caldicellulosiruptor saccharolyticus DSM 8903]|uniref:DUF8042 domain-containing protein n=1 Tax=Caldicellulosiruptor saccharolyticus (strain ATCC 43494 / DSM 8903 / Tp8T 6331) TaxID=351627 RepID=A4XLJ8_CALS8|nr:hypothetical protein [Caldicellulosiruptor saccharolyticus]ABP67783.1 hypothetical protein Csac_2203 [Caldicellulosiruptor saccharolyticus DSM 8903]